MVDGHGAPLETSNGHTIHDLTTAAEIEEYLGFANTILGVDPDDPYMRELYAVDRLVREIEHGNRGAFVIRDDVGIAACGMVKRMTVRDCEDRQITDTQEPLVLVEYGAVREDLRRRGLFTLLEHYRFEWARKHGIAKLVGEIEVGNLPRLHCAFKNGFVATHIMGPALGIPGPFFILRKTLS